MAGDGMNARGHGPGVLAWCRVEAAVADLVSALVAQSAVGSGWGLHRVPLADLNGDHGDVRLDVRMVGVEVGRACTMRGLGPGVAECCCVVGSGPRIGGARGLVRCG